MIRLRSLLRTAFVGLVLGPLVLLGASLGWVSFNAQLDNAQRYTLSRAQYLALQVEDLLLDLRNDIRAATRFRSFLHMSTATRRDILLELMSGQPMLREIALVKPDGGQTLGLSAMDAHAPQETKDWSGVDCFNRALQSGRPVFGSIRVDQTTLEPLMYLALPLKNLYSGQLHLVMVATVRLKALWNMVATFSPDQNEQAFVTDGDGHIVAHADPSFVLAPHRFSVDPDARLQRGVDGRLAVAASHPAHLGDKTLLAVAVHDARFALQPVVHSAMVYAAIFLLALCLAGFLLFMARRKIVKPIQDLTDTAKAIRDGDLTAKALSGGYYETGELARTFNAMTERLTESMRSLESEVAFRKQVEEELRFSRERLDLALNAVSDGLWDWNLVTDEVHFSDRWATMLGYSPDEIEPCVGTWRKLLHPEDAEKNVADLFEHSESGEEMRCEFRLQAKDGSWRWILSRGKVVARDAGGRPTRMIGTHVDIHSRKQMETVVRSLFEETTGIVGQEFFERSLTLLCQWLDADIALIGKVDEQEQKAETLAMLVDGAWAPLHAYPLPGSPCEEVVSKGVCVHERGVQQLFPADRDIADLGVEGYAGTALMDSRGRRTGMLVVMSRRPLRISTRMQHIMSLVADRASAEIERMRTEEALRVAKEKAEAANAAKSEFLANMSHELRTPLNGAQGMLQLLQLSTLEKDQAEYVNVALRSCNNLTRLLGDLLDLSRVEAGRMPLNAAPFGLKPLLAAVRETYADLVRSKNLALTLHMAPGLPDGMVGDAVRVRQVLFNLVGNAVKFTDSGSIGVEAFPLPSTETAHRVLFVVSDSGIGIPDDKLDLVFEPFTQVEGSFTRPYQGAGLGLQIVKRLVVLMGGSICVLSEEGRGTAMYIALPFDRLTAEAAPAKSRFVEPRVSLPDEPVLLAEDEPTNRLGISRMLEKAGYAVVSANNGQEVLAALREQSFACILMDIQMPVMDGLEATRRIRTDPALAHRAKTPIVALTAHAMAGDREHFLAAGMNGYVSKPVALAELTATIQTVIAESCGASS